MGSSKAWLDLAGEPLLARVVGRVAEVAFPVVVVAANGQALPPLPDGVLVARDPVSGRGPLQGLVAGLDVLAGRATSVFASSTDVPFLHPALIRRLHALRGPQFDVVVPRVRGHLHPLSALCGIEAHAAARALLAADRLRMTSLFEGLRTLVADDALLLEGPGGQALRAADPELLSLENVNTQADYAAALARLRG